MLFAIVLNNEKTQLMQDRQQRSKPWLTLPTNIGHFEKKRVKAGCRLTKPRNSPRTQCGQYAKKVEYFWINDLNHIMIMHAVKPELDGKS